MLDELTRHAILVDWGTSNLRAYLLQPDGECAHSKEGAHGVKRVPKGKCSEVLKDFLAEWLAAYDVGQVLMAGMVGSEIGWCVVPLVPSPCSEIDLSRNLMGVDFAGGPRARIVPGVSAEKGGELLGIMRGEEVQTFGAMAIAGKRDGIVCLPGSHSKWVEVATGRLDNVSTFMTGELFDLMRTQSTLKECLAGASDRFDDAAFRAGVDVVQSGCSLMQAMFSIRSEYVSRPVLTSTERRSRLSGILIAAELRAALRVRTEEETGEVLLVCSRNLAHAYQTAFSMFGRKMCSIDSTDAFLAGCRRILMADAGKGRPDGQSDGVLGPDCRTIAD